MTKELRRWLRTPPVKWESLYKRVGAADVFRTEAEAAEIATHLARISGYISRRMNGGKHTDAVKSQNRVARGTRQALGYTYADDKITF